jgi:2,3-bisphosphoglycerate-dependent phosphoglycerate mutase
LKDVYTRVVPYYEKSIKEDLKAGKNVLVVAHGNTLRALIKHLEDLDENQICDVEVGTGEVHCYHVDSDAKFISKEVKTS